MKTIMTLVYIFIITTSSLAQLNISPELYNQIDGKIKFKYGDSTSLTNYFVVDSLVIKNCDYCVPSKIFDPYNQLRGVIIFTAFVNHSEFGKKGLVGLYKEGNILWDSDTSIYCNDINMLYLFSTNDINRDGKVEIFITAERWGTQVGTNLLYIYSWDGSIGSLISELDNEGFSKIATLTNIGDFEFIDSNGDGIFEIRGLGYLPGEDVNEKLATYYWNGMNYSFNPSSFQPQSFNYLPRNNIHAEVSVNAKKLNSDYFYDYSIYNLSSSVQEINTIYFQLKIDSSNIVAIRNGWEHYNFFDLLGFEDFSMTNDRFPTKFIMPGEIDASIKLSNHNPPTIIKFYLQGYNQIPLDSLITFESDYADILDNSYVGFTLGPGNVDSSFIPLDFLDTLLNYNQRSFELGWTTNTLTTNKYASYFNSAKTQLQQNNIAAVQNFLQTVLQEVNIDSTSSLRSEAYALLRYNTEYLLEQLPQSSPNLIVSLKNSQGALLTTGSLQYYEGSWKDAVNNGDGTFTVTTNLATVSLRMAYEYGSQTVANINAHNNTYIFQTVSATVQLKNSLGNLIDAGTVQYYSGAWRTFGATTNGVATKELLPINYSFRMAYEFASIDKQQNLSVDPTVVFQTVNATVQLKNSLGNLIDTGSVQYYSGAWRNFGATTNGVANKELLPINYSFRMAYEFASVDKQQNLSIDPTVVFQTVNATVQLKNSLGNLIDAGTVQYYSGAWRNFGTTTNGVANKELLPINYSFRMAYEFASIDKQQNLSSNPTIVFQTVNAAVQLKNSSGNLIDAGTVQYYSGAWRNFGATTNGVANKELLPINYSFRMAYEFASIDKQQNLSVDPTVVFQTVNATVQLKNRLGNLIDAGTVQYYSGAWRNFGTTTNGVASKELLPINYSFRMTYEYVSNDKQQNLNTNPVVNFVTVLCSVKVSNATNQPLNNANVKYYAGAWRDLGITNAEGITIKELLPANLSFRASLGNLSKDKEQNILVNSLVEINLNTP